MTMSGRLDSTISKAASAEPAEPASTNRFCDESHSAKSAKHRLIFDDEDGKVWVSTTFVPGF